MLTRKEIVGLVIEELGGGAAPDTHKYHPRVVAAAVNIELSESISKIIQKQERQGDHSVDSTWIKPFDKNKVKWDSGRKQCYVDYPTMIISLSKNKGLREVRWLNESTSSPAFTIIDATAYSVISNLECSQLDDGVYHAAPEGDKIFFPDMPSNIAQMNAKVRIKMIAGVDAFKDTEVLPIPGEDTASIVERIVQRLQGFSMKRQKMANDTNPNTA